MTRRKLRNDTYDDICRALTNYEEGNADADDLYNALVAIQNKWEDLMGED